jgi:hypothetical protein
MLRAPSMYLFLLQRRHPAVLYSRIHVVDMASSESSNSRCSSLRRAHRHSRERCPLDRDAAIAMAGDNETKGLRRIQLLKRLKRGLHGLKQNGINLEASSIGQSSQAHASASSETSSTNEAFHQDAHRQWSMSPASPFALAFRGIARY